MSQVSLTNRGVVFVNNAGFAAIFRELAGFLELKGENPFKIRAYTRAADILESLDEDVAQLAGEGQLKNIKGIGKTIEEKTQEIARSGTLKALEDLKSEYPPGVMDMTKVPGVGSRTASLIFRELGVASIDELEKAAHDGKLKTLPGMGKKSEENILKAIEKLKEEDMTRIPLVIMDELGESLIDFVSSHTEVYRISVVGSVRRRKEACRDLDILVGMDDSSRIPDLVMSWGNFRGMISCEEDRVTFTAADDVEVDISIVKPEDFPFALLATTGSKQHYASLKSHGRRLGLEFGKSGLFHKNGEIIRPTSEAGIYEALGMEYIPPELREMTGEIEAALEHRLPKLLVSEDIRGDLHMHTNWSDGRESIESMVEATKALGYRYVAVTDHSRSLKIARGLSETRLFEQLEMLRQLQDRFTGIHVLSGIELEILKDGSLDYPDSILSRFDIVVASVHSAFRQPEDIMTGRIIRAIRSGSVDIIAHPTGRVLGRRFGYDVDMDAVIEEAARHDVALEINAYPERMDLDSTWARKAMERGAYIAINTDAHNSKELHFMWYGLDVARRAWLEQPHVINTWSLSKLQAWLGQRRERA